MNSLVCNWIHLLLLPVNILNFCEIEMHINMMIGPIMLTYTHYQLLPLRDSGLNQMHIEDVYYFILV